MWLRMCSVSVILCFALADKNFYEILGIKPSATQKDVEKAYKNRQEEFRVLLRQGQMPETDKLQKLIEAFATLSNSNKRALYDASLVVKADKMQAKKNVRKSVDEDSDRSNYLSRKQLNTLAEKDLDDEDYKESFTDFKSVHSAAFSQSSFSQNSEGKTIKNSRSGGFHSDGECKTVTKRDGESVSTTTTCN